MHLRTSCGNFGLYIMYSIILSTFSTVVKGQKTDEFQLKNTTCSTDGDCITFPNSVCNGENTHCKCIKDYGVVDHLKRHSTCEKLATKLEDPCDYPAQCQLSFGIGSICKDNKCICHPKFEFNSVNSYCYMKNLTSYNCSSGYDCSGEDCDNGYCKCQNDQILRKPNVEQTQCLTVGDKVCVIDEQCQLGKMGKFSTCRNGTCGCPDNYKERDSLCLGGIDAPCKNYTDCYHSYCNNDGNCKCPIGKKSIDNDCDEKFSLGDNCTHETQCSGTVQHSNCSTICQCNNNFIAINGFCYNVAEKHGSFCEKNEQCNIHLQNMECTGKFCSCKSEFQICPNTTEPFTICSKPCECDRTCPPEQLIADVVIVIIAVFATFFVIMCMVVLYHRVCKKTKFKPRNAERQVNYTSVEK